MAQPYHKNTRMTNIKGSLGSGTKRMPMLSLSDRSSILQQYATKLTLLSRSGTFFHFLHCGQIFRNLRP